MAEKAIERRYPPENAEDGPLRAALSFLGCRRLLEFGGQSKKSALNHIDAITRQSEQVVNLEGL